VGEDGGVVGDNSGRGCGGRIAVYLAGHAGGREVKMFVRSGGGGGDYCGGRRHSSNKLRRGLSGHISISGRRGGRPLSPQKDRDAMTMQGTGRTPPVLWRTGAAGLTNAAVLVRIRPRPPSLDIEPDARIAASSLWAEEY
jgi:hypothetical protein